jgi:hypothetical protein
VRASALGYFTDMIALAIGVALGIALERLIAHLPRLRRAWRQRDWTD